MGTATGSKDAHGIGSWEARKTHRLLYDSSRSCRLLLVLLPPSGVAGKVLDIYVGAVYFANCESHVSEPLALLEKW